MELRVLGSLQVHTPEGSDVRLVSAPQRRLLSVLAVSHGTTVAADLLADRLGLSAGALRTAVSRLRRIVGSDALVTRPGRYELRVERLDVVDFEAALALARSDAGPEAAIAALRRALGLWRGQPYAEFADEEWAAVESHRLSELHAGAAEDLVEHHLGRREWAPALALLDPLVAAHPFRDRPRAQLVRALADSGRRVEALRSFQDYRAFLLEETGTEPSAEIVALDREVAQRRAPEPDEPNHNLRPAVSSFVGRERELSTVRALIDSHRLVTLTGAGGSGKSRLAREVAQRSLGARPAGTWWVELGPVTGVDQVVDHLARALGLPTASDDPTAQVVRRLQAGSVLVVLDNAEHVLDGVVNVVAALLIACPEARVLVTSREPLGLPGEQVWPVPPLSLPGPAALDRIASSDAARLFLERVRQVRPGLVVDDEAVGHFIAICSRLDGLPLALELAAARARTVPLRHLAVGLDDAFGVLDEASEAVLGRHQTLRASISWSTDLLDPDDRLVLHRLSVFQSPFTVDAAQAVAGDDQVGEGESVLACVRHLADKSLLQLDDRSERYRMLETIRQFCADHLDADELHDLRARHARWYARWCTEVGEGVHGIEREPVRAEMPDVVAAMVWARSHAPSDALRMCAGLAAHRTMLGHRENLRATCQWLLALDRDGDLSAPWAAATAATTAAATAASMAEATPGAFPDLSAVSGEVEARLAPGDDRARRWLARGRSMVAAYRGDVAPMITYSEAVVARGDDVEASVYVGFTAYMAALSGQLVEAARWVDELHQVTRRHHTAFSVDTVGNGFAAAALVATTRGDLLAAGDLLQRDVPRDPTFSITAAAALTQAALMRGDLRALAQARTWARHGTIQVLEFLLAGMDLHRALADGDLEDAAHAAEQYWREAAAVPVSRVHQCAFVTLALVETGRVASAERIATEAAGLVDAMGDVPLLEAAVLQSRAQVACRTGRETDAAIHARELLELAHLRGFGPMVIDALEVLAVLAHRAGGREDRAALIHAVRAERERTGYRLVMVVPRAAIEEVEDAVPSTSDPPSLAATIARARRLEPARAVSS